MSKTATVQARMAPELKEQADVILASLGINASTAITLFYTQVVRHRGIPLELKVPNEGVIEAMRELKDPISRKTAKKHDNIADMMADLTS